MICFWHECLSDFFFLSPSSNPNIFNVISFSGLYITGKGNDFQKFPTFPQTHEGQAHFSTPRKDCSISKTFSLSQLCMNPAKSCLVVRVQAPGPTSVPHCRAVTIVHHFARAYLTHYAGARCTNLATCDLCITRTHIWRRYTKNSAVSVTILVSASVAWLCQCYWLSVLLRVCVCVCVCVCVRVCVCVCVWRQGVILKNLCCGQ